MLEAVFCFVDCESIRSEEKKIGITAELALHTQAEDSCT